MNVPTTVYSAGYNICRFSFNYEKNIKNWCDFVGPRGQTVIAVNTSEDNTWEELVKLQKQCPNLELIKTDISYSNNRIDGLTKTAALEQAKNSIRILMDFDEFFIPSQKKFWDQAVELLTKDMDSRWDGFLIPSLDLYGSIKTIRKNCNIGQKFRIHKDTIKSRGVIPQAELGNGYFNTKMSDCTEGLTADGQLGKFAQYVPYEYLKPENAKYLSFFPVTVHESYLDLKRKASHGKEYWKKIWEGYSNHQENVATDIKELEYVEVIEHGLNLE
jgi:hypothetical protein